MVLATIGLGSNLQQPQGQITAALHELQGLPHCRLIGQSGLYRSPPLVSAVDPVQDQPDYINAVAVLETSLGPEALLGALQTLEQAHGRVRMARWGPRTLDLDLLLYGDLEVSGENLTIPHPGLYDRNFVLYPLAELVERHALELAIPGGQDLAALLARCPRGELTRLNT